jgi:hypothetical protein
MNPFSSITPVEAKDLTGKKAQEGLKSYEEGMDLFTTALKHVTAGETKFAAQKKANDAEIVRMQTEIDAVLAKINTTKAQNLGITKQVARCKKAKKKIQTFIV